jgi:DNA invertase Pin-like site-specific DNA recombinase
LVKWPFFFAKDTAKSGMKYGYARVSTDGHSVAAQVVALKAAGAGNVFREVASGAGDVLMVTRLDRLARSTRDLLNTLAAITGKKAGFPSLGDAWASEPYRSRWWGTRRRSGRTVAP